MVKTICRSHKFPITVILGGSHVHAQTGSRGDRRAQGERQVGANAAAARRFGECVPVKFSSAEILLVILVADLCGSA